MSKEMLSLFEVDQEWREHWQGMPEYVTEDLTPHRSIIVHFETAEDVEAFAELIQQRLTTKTKFVWYPATTLKRLVELRYVDES